MADEIGESTLNTCEGTSPRKSVPKTDTNVIPVVTEEENKVAATEIASNGNTWERRQSDAQQPRKFLETSGRETDFKSPEIVERMDELKDNTVRHEKEDTVMRYLTPEENPYDKAMSYLHKHSLPSLFQYITINLAYQRPEDAIDFMIDEVTKRSQGQYEETKRSQGQHEETKRNQGQHEETKRSQGQYEETKRSQGQYEETKMSG